MNPVKWPKGYIEFYKQVAAARKLIQTGLMVAIDPSSGGSSKPGYAIYKAGVLQRSGEIELPKKQTIYVRLQLLYKEIIALSPTPPDVFVLEGIRGQNFSHHHLIWSIGATIAAARTPVTIEVPLNVWHALAKADPDYEKTNTADAELIGLSLIELTKEPISEAS